jgi:endoglucanase
MTRDISGKIANKNDMTRFQIFLFTFLFFLSCFSVAHAQQIRLNQLGFYPNAPKIAIAINDADQDSFFVVSLPKHGIAWRGRLGAMKKSANSSLMTRIADFTALNKRGEYKILIQERQFLYFYVDEMCIDDCDCLLKVIIFFDPLCPWIKFAGKWAGASILATAVLVHPSAAQNRPEQSFHARGGTMPGLQ